MAVLCNCQPFNKNQTMFPLHFTVPTYTVTALAAASHQRRAIVWPEKDPGYRTLCVQEDTTWPWRIKKEPFPLVSGPNRVIFVRTLLPSAGPFLPQHTNLHCEPGWEGPRPLHRARGLLPLGGTSRDPLPFAFIPCRCCDTLTTFLQASLPLRW